MSSSLKTSPLPPSPSPSSLQEHHTIPPLIISDCSHVRDTLSCLLHTILFQRSLGPISVRDCTCDFCDVTYCQAKSASSKSKGGDDNDFVVGKYVEDKIQRVIEHCMQMAVSTNHRVKEVTVLLHFYEKTMTTTTKKTSKNNSASNSHNSSPRGGAGTSSSSWKNGISGGGGAATTSSLTNRMRNEDNAQAKKFGRKWETWQISLEMWDEDSLLVNSRGESMEKQRERAANDLAETLSGTMTHILALCEEKKEHVPAVTTERMPSFPFEIELVEIDGLNSRGGSGSQGGVFSSSFGMLKKLLKDSTPTQLI